MTYEYFVGEPDVRYRIADDPLGMAIRRSRAVNEVFGTAVERGYFSHHPLNGLRWSAPEVADEVDPDCVPNPAQVARLLAAVRALPGRGPHL
ncbi:MULTISPECIES: hypothetical protein [unclassified Streptomyces]|uniref:hypothetical protein n=1 Tax=unclassified Streptomyces TaxID=2593676 RepID=UPI000710FF76|nr:hypothetical protein [Streptomyces sp. NBC_00425]KRD02302.1 hypothetical protein ASE41_34410 [Streptomyces sp. Root264]